MNERRIAVAAADTETAHRKRKPAAASAPAAAVAAPPVSKEDDKLRKRREAEARQKRTAKLGPLEKQVAQLEERIGVLEAEQKTCSAEPADPSVYEDAPRRNKLLADYQGGQDKLDDFRAALGDRGGRARGRARRVFAASGSGDAS